LQRRGLGRGLEELLGEKPAGVETIMVEVERIRPNPFQPRREMDEEGIKELAESIRTHGLLQPILVRRVGDGYEVTVGERRWRAAQVAGLERVPVMVRGATDQDMLQLALVENLQREDLKPLEEAEAYYTLMQQYGMTQEEVAAAVGKERATVANTLRLLSLPLDIRDGLRTGEMSRGQGLALASLVGSPKLRQIWKKVREEGLNVRQTEELVRKVLEPRRRMRMGLRLRDVEIDEMERELRFALGSLVAIKHRADSQSGKIEIRYNSLEELRGIRGRIVGGQAPT